MNVGDDAAFVADALALVTETREAGFPVVLIMTKAVGAGGVLLVGRQVGGRDVETGARGILVQGEGAFPRRDGVGRLPQLVAEKGRLRDLVAVRLIDRVGVGRLVFFRAGFLGPASDFGRDSRVVADFPDLVSLLLAVWKRARCGEKSGKEEEL